MSYFSVIENKIKDLSTSSFNNYDFNNLNVEFVKNYLNLKFMFKKFISDDIFNDNIKILLPHLNTLKYMYNFDVVFKNINFKCHLLIFFDIKSSNYIEIQLIYHILYIFYHLYNRRLNINENFTVNIYFYLYDFNRSLKTSDLKDKSLNGISKSKRFNCASGYTTLDKKKIVITRYNHFSSLLIHELIHFYNLDQQELSICSNWNSLLLKNYNKTSNGYFFEAIDNFKASIINLFIKKYFFMNLSKNSNILKIYDSDLLFKIEYFYSLFLCLKILKLVKSNDLIDMMGHNEYFDGSFFEYSFGKCLLMENIQLFNNDEELTFNCNLYEFDDILQKFNIRFDKNTYKYFIKLFETYKLQDQEEIDYYFI